MLTKSKYSKRMVSKLSKTVLNVNLRSLVPKLHSFEIQQFMLDLSTFWLENRAQRLLLTVLSKFSDFKLSYRTNETDYKCLRKSVEKVIYHIFYERNFRILRTPRRELLANIAQTLFLSFWQDFTHFQISRELTRVDLDSFLKDL